MASYFLDTSALVKLYHVELGTPRVEQLFDDLASRRVVSRVGLVEIHSAFAVKLRSQEIGETAFENYRRRLWTDLSQRRMEVFRMRGAHFLAAEQLILKYARTRRLRTLDAIQLAIAQDAQKLGVVDHFVCADTALCDIAAAETLKVVIPMDA